MKVSEAYGAGKFGLSFELFPPKTEAGERTMFGHLVTLMEFKPSYVTCTYGAGGSTRDKTLDIVEQVRHKHRLSVAAHLTCVGATADDLRRYLSDARQRGIENIVALRGDPPKGNQSFEPIPGGLRFANELVALIRSEFSDFGIAVAGYPEKHVEAPSLEIDLENLKRKVDAGADVVLTQLFYDNEDFFRFRESYDALGIKAPLVPGILPVTNLAQIRRITSMCGAKLPCQLVSRLEQYEDEPDGQFDVGVQHATAQTQGLIDAGVPGVHFYVLNKSQATSSVLRAVSRPV